MKKLLVLALTLLTLTGCGNYNAGFGNYTFNKVHIICSGKCIELTSWHENDVGIEVHTKDYGSLYFSEGTYILVENKCPICDE